MTVRACLVSALAAFALASCARPSERIATTLIDYGLPQGQAECMGEGLERDLSPAQLLELVRLVRAYRQNDPDPGRLTLQNLLPVASQIRDPQVPIIVARNAATCRLLH